MKNLEGSQLAHRRSPTNRPQLSRVKKSMASGIFLVCFFLIPSTATKADSFGLSTPPKEESTATTRSSPFGSYHEIIERYEKRRNRSVSNTEASLTSSKIKLAKDKKLRSTYSRRAKARKNIAPLIQRETSLNLRKEEAQFSWNIADISLNEQAPNILSELIWDDLVIDKVTLNHKLLPIQGKLKDMHLEAEMSFGLVNEGWVSDADYDGDNRTEEYSRSISKPSGSKILSISNAIGYRWNLSHQLSLTPLLGYSYHAQRFYITEGRQVISTSDRTPDPGIIHGLNSYYDAFWYGPWLGMEISFQHKRHRLTARGQTGETRYHAEANWNLRDDLAHPKSFEHDANARNHSGVISYSYQATQRFAVMLSYCSERWRTDAGRDRIYFEDGSISTTQLNQARWDSDSVVFGFVAHY